MHTNLKQGEHRKNPLNMKVGDKIGMIVQGGVAEGTITGTDQGDWIYCYNWTKTNGQKLPGYFRATQCFKLD